MKVTAKHLAYASVLAVGAIALLLDSAFPPASAAAAIDPPVGDATATVLAGAASAYTMPLDTGLAPLADRLAALNQRHARPDEPTRDAFALDEAAWGLTQAPEPQIATLTNDPDTSLQLTAIMANHGEGVAVINGTMAHVGDMLKGGYRVLSISPQKVTLDLDGHIITLSVRRQP